MLDYGAGVGSFAEYSKRKVWVLEVFETDTECKKSIKERKIKYWELDFEYVKTAFKDLMESESFITYSKLENPTINQDREIIIFFFKEIIAITNHFSI